ncbi:LANO_0A04566g1_1 [Lachancea nothofagi CBS 11611]|uniref:LANO_0A04566g1_1 n=1 Tax=Lachancea nothofagi CBS 11611 TaxID=1266666 RepID=A0A1G4IQE3_9SACH|nr:LANO_0A04566g1_1 [Lachancea nothofagi CBS 11611]
MATYETARDALEQQETIENAIAVRLNRNPELFFRSVDQWKTMGMDWQFPEESLSQKEGNRVYSISKPRRSRKQLLSQEHEIKAFLDTYRRNCCLLENINFGNNENEVSDNSIDQLLAKIESINSQFPETTEDDVGDEFAMFSSSTSTHRNILSRKAQNLDINAIFTRDEQYGELLDLNTYHLQWLGVVKNGDVTFLQFLDELDKFKSNNFLLKPAVSRSSSRYRDFVNSLLQYLEDYAKRAYSLLEWDSVYSKISIAYQPYLAEPIEVLSGSLYCIPCDKNFKAETVYRSHLSGKKHLSNRVKNESFLAQEHKLHQFCTFLTSELSRTREFVERKLAFTSEERAQELARITAAYEAPAYDPQEPEVEFSPEFKKSSATEDSSTATDASFSLPLGPDGFPIPYWLYKLQGLDIEYRCEICGNCVYKGRRQFEKHFSEQRHTFGLRRLGIEPTATFQGVTTISDAQNLASHLKTRTVTTVHPGAVKLDLEVEDDDGNVMSEQVYQELKKQGLL